MLRSSTPFLQKMGFQSAHVKHTQIETYFQRNGNYYRTAIPKFKKPIKFIEQKNR